MRIDVSVVIPCLNAERTVGKCVGKALRAISDIKIPGEVIVVDNASEDGSARVALDAGAVVVFCPQRGYGAACTRGFREAQGRFLVMGDDDETYDFLDIPKFVSPLRDRKCDFVLGTRLGGTMAEGSMSLSHRVGNEVLTAIFRCLFRMDISDLTCGFRAFRREFLDRVDLKTKGMEYSTEMLIRAAQCGTRVRTVPISYRPPSGTPSRMKTIPDGCRILRLLLTEAVRRPLWDRARPIIRQGEGV